MQLSGDNLQRPPAAARGQAAVQDGPGTCLGYAQEIIEALPAAIYTTDADGYVLAYNRAAAELWGREPVRGKDLWCGCWRIFRPDGTPMPVEQCPMAVAIREQRPVRGEEIVLERPDGTCRRVLPHPQPLFDSDGRFIGAVNMLVDITDRRRMEQALWESETRYRAIFGQAAVGLLVADRDGRILEANDRMCQILRRSAEELRSLTCAEITHPEDWPQNSELLDQLLSGARREFSMEKRYLRVAADGRALPAAAGDSWVWVHVSVSALYDELGRPRRILAIVEDITQRRQFREELERQVRQRSLDLEHAHRRLRERERLTSLGTLSAGLGHDLANLLLPLRVRLDALSDRGLGPEVAEELGAIRRGLDYLQRLASGLRLMSMDPETVLAGSGATVLESWWAEAEGVLRAVMPRGSRLQFRMRSTGLPPVAIGTAELTQAVFNLVQNAAEAMGSRPDGLVTITGGLEPRQQAGDSPAVRLTITDNGPGMDPETLRRCFEPYYSTKTRAISTGTGLPLVRALVLAAGGSVWCESAPGQGAAFIMVLPAAPTADGQDAEEVRAKITIRPTRAVALATALLNAQGVRVVRDSSADAELWITDVPDEEQVSAFLAADPRRCVVLWGASANGMADHSRVVASGPHPDTRTIRTCFDQALKLLRSTALARR